MMSYNAADKDVVHKVGHTLKSIFNSLRNSFGFFIKSIITAKKKKKKSSISDIYTLILNVCNKPLNNKT